MFRVNLNAFPSGMHSMHRLELAMTNKRTKFEVPGFIHSK